MQEIDAVSARGSSRRTRRGTTAALVAAVSLVLGLLALAQAPAASALTGTINSSLPATSPGGPWNIPFLAKVVSTQLTVNGAAADFSVAPALPQGLFLTTAGVFSGIPSVLSPATTYTITASVVGDPVPLTMPLTLAVVPSLVVPTGTILGAVGQQLPALYTIKSEGFTVPTLTFSPPQPWLSVDAKGVLSGIPPAVGQQTVTVTAFEAGFPAGQSATGTINISISASATPPPGGGTGGVGLTPATQTSVGTVGAPLSPALAAFPASATTTYTITPDIAALTGLTFTAATGLVSGTPTKPIASGTSFTIQQRDTATSSVLASSTLSLTVDGSLGAAQSIKVTAGASLTPVVPFSPAAAIAAGLASPITFSIAPTLPAGLSLDPATGALSGIPGAATSGSFVVTATDGTGAKATGTVTLSVGGSLTPAVQSLTGTVGQNLASQVMSATGMQAPVTFSIAPAAPGGLSFDSATGVLSGIPTVPILNATFTITATDATSTRSTASLGVTVSQAFLSVPVIGTVRGGPEVGSLQVYFATPSGAAAGSSYNVQVYDATGTTLITTVTTTTSPVTITGLVGGTTYSVIVAAGGTDGSSPVQSLPRTGTASSTATLATTSAAAGTVPFSLASGSSASNGFSLADFGIVVGTAAKSKKATKAFATKKPARTILKSEKIHVPLNTLVSIVIPKVPVKGQIQVLVRVQKHQWVSAGYVQVDKSGQLTLPALQSSKPGTYPIKLKPPAGKSGLVRIVFDAPAKTTSSSGSATTSTATSSTKKPTATQTPSGF